MSSPSRKRQKLSSPRPSTSIETIPISSDEDEDDDKPKFIQMVEDISSGDSDPEIDIKPSLKIRSISRTTAPSAFINSPIMMLTQASLLDTFSRVGSLPPEPECPSTVSVATSSIIEVSKADSQSNIISTTSLPPFSSDNKISTLGSPRNMVQEISSTVVTHKRFLLTGLNNCKHETKERIKIMIKQLGGEYIDCPNFVERCTHIVLGKPNTGEKYMGGLMTGKWLLKTEYVEDSYAENRWLEEEGYEWTKDTIMKLNPETDPELAKLASSARRCRLRYNAEGPFHGWTASILSNHPRRLECYERLFKAGGGRVINISDYRKRHNELTYILVDNPDQTHIPLKNPTVPLLRINYIHNVVLEDDKPDQDVYLVKREESKNELPTVPWLCTFSTVKKATNLTSKKCPRQLLDYIDGITCPESWGAVLLPLASNQAPPPYMLRSVINKSFLPRSDKEFGQLRQVLSDLHILSWFIPPTSNKSDNREYYANVLKLKDKPHSADKFIALLEDAIKSDEERSYPQSCRYLIFWLALLEKDFYNWERMTNFSKPLIERIMNSWNKPRSQPVFKKFINSYINVMTADPPNDRLKMALNSHMIIYFTSNEIKRQAKGQKPFQKGNTLDYLSDCVCEVVRITLKKRSIRLLHVLLHMLSFSYTLVIVALNKVLVSLDHSRVPPHYTVLAERPPSWEKFYNFFLHIRHHDAEEEDPLFSCEAYLILLSALYRALYRGHSKPPALLNPTDKTLELQQRLEEEGCLSLSGRLILKLLVKSAQ